MRNVIVANRHDPITINHMQLMYKDQPHCPPVHRLNNPNNDHEENNKLASKSTRNKINSQ